MDPKDVKKEEEEVKLPKQEELLDILEGKSQDEQDEAQTEEKGEEPKYTEREQAALGYGWLPKEAWVEKGGDPEDWRPARDFLERGEFIGKIRSLTKESQDTQRTLKHMLSEQKAMYDKGYATAIAKLKQERKDALVDGDVLKADDIGDQIDAVKEQQRKAAHVPQVQQPDPEHQAWVDRNQWYNEPVMQEIADGLARSYIKANPNVSSAADVRAYVEKIVKEEWKHRFNPPPVRSAPNPDSSGTGAPRGKTSTGKSELSKIEADMPEEHRQMMKTMLKADPTFTKEEYLKMYSTGR